MSEYILDLTAFDDETLDDGLREEIVRCRDCTYGTHFFHHDDERWQCANPYQDGDDVKPDAYCWRGKRKDRGDGE